VAVNCMNAIPQLLRCDSTLNRNWIKIKLVGVKSNRSGIGSRVLLTALTSPEMTRPLLQTEELRSGGSYFSQNDLRLHFGLDQAKKADLVEIRWLSGQVDQIRNLAANQLHVIQEGGKVLSSAPLPPVKARGKIRP
jgi:enediyne biosynthesis protein E4